MKQIVNVNKKWGIGLRGGLLVNIPEDMKFFRETTRGAVLIMGSTTLESFPRMAPLRGRVNIVLIDDDRKIREESVAAAEADREAGYDTELIYVRSLPEAVELGCRYEAVGREVFVIGGATVYRIMLPYCDTCIVTVNDCELEADTFYPDLSADPDWEETDRGEAHEWNGVKFRFTTWKRREG